MCQMCQQILYPRGPGAPLTDRHSQLPVPTLSKGGYSCNSKRREVVEWRPHCLFPSCLCMYRQSLGLFSQTTPSLKSKSFAWPLLPIRHHRWPSCATAGPGQAGLTWGETARRPRPSIATAASIFQLVTVGSFKKIWKPSLKPVP